jgi:hypothetical protein
MLYIHSLKDLNPKSADIESTMLIRELKGAVSFPITDNMLKDQVLPYFVSKIDLESMNKSLEAIQQCINDVNEFSKTGKELELISIQRTIAGLNELLPVLQNSIAFANELTGWQDQFIAELKDSLNTMASTKDLGQKKAHEQRIGVMLERMLRNKNAFAFSFFDVVNEAHTARVNNLIESIGKGFFFHIKLEEFVKKQDFAEISQRIIGEDLDRTNQILAKMREIKKGIDRAYDVNMRMVNLAVILYSYAKWLRAARL